MNIDFRKIVSAGGLFLLSLLILGGIYFFVFPKETVQDKQSRVAEVVERGDINRCQDFRELNIEGVGYEVVCRNNIVYRQAMNTLDVKICDQLDGQMMKSQDCRQAVIVSGVSERGGDFCANLTQSDLTSFCGSEVSLQNALVSNNQSNCQDIEDQNRRRGCERSIFDARLEQLESGSALACTGLVGRYVKDCEAYQSKNCVAIEDIHLKEMCFSVNSSTESL